MDEIKLVSVDAPSKNGNVVYAILAKPKKPIPWWNKHFLELLIIGYCVIQAWIVLVSPV
jgi:hypothetical protein